MVIAAKGGGNGGQIQRTRSIRGKLKWEGTFDIEIVVQ